MMHRKIIIAIMILISTISWGQDNISLITPDDGDTIQTKTPLFSWLYLDGSTQGNGHYYYRLIVVELNENQSAEAGIIVNQPLITIDPVPSTQFFYPYDAPELQDGHRYGWQVQKISNNVVIDKSEAWEFILPLPIPPVKNYYKMKVKNDGILYQANEGKLYLYFNEQYSDAALNFSLYDNQGDLIDVNISLNPELEEEFQEINVIKTGANFYEIDLGDYTSAGVYKLVVVDSKHQKFTIKYEVK